MYWYLVHSLNFSVLHYPYAIAHDRNHIFCSHAIYEVWYAALWLNNGMSIKLMVDHKWQYCWMWRTKATSTLVDKQLPTCSHMIKLPTPYLYKITRGRSSHSVFSFYLNAQHNYYWIQVFFKQMMKHIHDKVSWICISTKLEHTSVYANMRSGGDNIVKKQEKKEFRDKRVILVKLLAKNRSIPVINGHHTPWWRIDYNNVGLPKKQTQTQTQSVQPQWLE